MVIRAALQHVEVFRSVSAGAQVAKAADAA
jgi:hypothetical protein